MCVSDAINVKKSSVLACVRSDTSSTNRYQSLENENTGVQEIREKYRIILDNFTLENIISLVESMTLLSINSDACLINIVEYFLKKALDDPLLAPEYAHVYLAMKNKEIQSGDYKKLNTSFTKLLINMCKDAFESMFDRKRIAAKERKQIESCKDKV
ncbi:eukaryotic translation initiation factor 4 gamma 3-like [Sipha flava]|uniref:Eukaryotic translation initiation factor 4 gamma 3-like n=1 Tax=Sipha flava TaxID=143950 RepID=A0A8B8FVI7_9HEMI|nr:eukaryotic translation initiation factor 4 gamma 3-like [Sipha flava]